MVSERNSADKTVVSMRHTFRPAQNVCNDLSLSRARALAPKKPAPLTLGTLLSFQPSCCSILSPLRWLHAMHAVTRLIQVLRPPLLTGVTWSMVRVVSRPLQPQYLAGAVASGARAGGARAEQQRYRAVRFQLHKLFTYKHGPSTSDPVRWRCWSATRTQLPSNPSMPHLNSPSYRASPLHPPTPCHPTLPIARPCPTHSLASEPVLHHPCHHPPLAHALPGSSTCPTPPFSPRTAAPYTHWQGHCPPPPLPSPHALTGR